MKAIRENLDAIGLALALIAPFVAFGALMWAVFVTLYPTI